MLKSYATWVTLAVALLMYAVFRTVEHSSVAEAMRVIALTVMAMMVPAYAPTAASCFVTPGWPAPKQWAGLAAFVLCFCMVLGSLVALFYRLAGRPVWLLEQPIVNATSFGLIVFGLVYTTAPGFFGDKVGARTKWALAGLWIASTALIALLVLAKPDLSPVARWIEQTLIVEQGRAS
ncbi:hypothetical protein [Methylobacterium thuringiense]|uniref:hypothetical protein n=1 Tax=Methylobacterium thuringiense TaxID=1003091 RepID=UPI001EDCFC19|nr:hypothetical protein [Methylobacterium thuringiense]